MDDQIASHVDSQDAQRAARNRIRWGWNYLNLMMVAIALIVGFGIWFVPDKTKTPEYVAWVKEQQELRKMRTDRLAAEAARLKEIEDLGIIYIEPGTNPFPTEPPKNR